jgi:hypothetical protein
MIQVFHHVLSWFQRTPTIEHVIFSIEGDCTTIHARINQKGCIGSILSRIWYCLLGAECSKVYWWLQRKREGIAKGAVYNGVNDLWSFDAVKTQKSSEQETIRIAKGAVYNGVYSLWLVDAVGTGDDPHPKISAFGAVSSGVCVRLHSPSKDIGL